MTILLRCEFVDSTTLRCTVPPTPASVLPPGAPLPAIGFGEMGSITETADGVEVGADDAGGELGAVEGAEGPKLGWAEASEAGVQLPELAVFELAVCLDSGNGTGPTPLQGPPLEAPLSLYVTCCCPRPYSCALHVTYIESYNFIQYCQSTINFI